MANVHSGYTEKNQHLVHVNYCFYSFPVDLEPNGFLFGSVVVNIYDIIIILFYYNNYIIIILFCIFRYAQKDTIIC